MLRFSTAGESHGEALVALVSGLPAGVPVDQLELDRELWRRQQGYGRGGRMRIERDSAHILSGVRHGKTIGSPVAMTLANNDWKNWEEILPVETGDAAISTRLSKVRARATPTSPARSSTTFPKPATSSSGPAPAKAPPASPAGRWPRCCWRSSACDVGSHVIRVGAAELGRDAALGRDRRRPTRARKSSSTASMPKPKHA